MGIGSYFPYFLYIVQPVDIDPSDTSLFDKGQRLLGGAYFLGKERAIRVGDDIYIDEFLLFSEIYQAPWR